MLVYDLEGREEGAMAGGVILSVDQQRQYVALADGPNDVEAKGVGSETYEKSDEQHQLRGSVGVIGKNGRRLMMMLAVGGVFALLLLSVGMRMSGCLWENVWNAGSSTSSGTAIALKDPPLGPGDPGVPIPYPKTLTGYHCRPAKNWISGKQDFAMPPLFLSLSDMAALRLRELVLDQCFCS